MNTERLVESMRSDYQALNSFKRIVLQLFQEDLNTLRTTFNCYYVEGSHDLHIGIPEKTKLYTIRPYIHVGINNGCFECNIVPEIKKLMRKPSLSAFKRRVHKFALKAGFEEANIKIVDL